jgi:Xaa-Pro dipeptidase
MVDFGACYQGYRSDVTRTFVMGKPDKRQAMLIKIVSQTQKKAIQAVKAGVLCGTIDKTARDFIKKHCFKHCQVSKKLCPGDCFIHSTGHGIGMKTHQFPRISLKSKTRLKNGMIITIEPGVYVKGWGGVRFEDMVRVTKSGAEILTQSSKVKCQK